MQRKEKKNVKQKRTKRAKNHQSQPHAETSSTPSPELIEQLATLSHELRTPLAVIVGSTSTLLRHGQRLSAQEQQEFLLMVLQAGRRLEVMTERFFELAALEAGTYPFTRSLLDLPVLVHKAFLNAQQRFPTSLQDRFTFHLQCRDGYGHPTELVPPLMGDMRALLKAIDVLVDNAIRFSPEGGRIDVIIQPTQDKRAVRAPEPCSSASGLDICVCDNGRGIAPEELQHIFDQFYQADSRLTREGGGLGLGLTLCRYLVALHGGRLWVQSCPAGGSAFHIWLPYEPERPLEE